MSIELVRNQINKFLINETPEVLAIRGKWGVGKTFAWNKFLEDAKKERRITLRRYAYVSLFGCNSLDSLKLRIFEQVIDTDSIGLKPSIETFIKSIESLTLGRNLLKFIPSLPSFKNANLSLFIDSVAFLSLNKVLICIDDVERKGDGLKIRDLLGFISVLKEEKDCKIAIILNDESLSNNEDEALKTYREKVIDIELLFDPTPEECSEIAIPSECYYSSKIKEFSKNLRINNIRIIRKILRLSNQLEPLLKGYEPELLHQSLHTMTLLALCYFQKDNNKIPSYEYLKNLGYKMYGLNDKKETEENNEWKAFLRKYSFYNIDEFDLEIAKAIENGFFNESSLLAEADKLNAKIIANKSKNSFSEAWNKYHNTFDSNEIELVASLYESFKENAQYIDPMNLNSTVKLLRDIGENEKADEIIELYIQNRKNDKEIFDLKRYPFASDIDDQRLIERFNSENKCYNDDRSPEEVISSLVGKNGWNQSDIEILSSLTVDDFYQIFTKQNGDHLSYWIDACLQFAQILNPSEEQKVISNNAREALVRIGKQSSLNARRVAKFGIKVESDA
ncbi:hypothetical protein H6G96_30270 [Nostoc sp. FACHB-892]|uniref:P-loop NTPase fold protein n=1 Tax=Nostoc sp. FACHB-892 TaxID=2692843 RepID=UPI001687E648|nr:P-loop NTPase fold protein [Nostoc sp. FACHB-892]MBD2730487.1 hypothetical protein [Nostoc sp. FACHB-892]